MIVDLIKAKKFTEELAKKAGKFLLKNQEKVKIKRYKDRQDIVTNIDLQAEKIIISAIEKKYPKHNINSEERDFINKNSQYTWYVDPLDGTKEYFRQIPEYNTSFSLFYKNKPILSIVYIPYSKQLFSAAKSVGAFLNNEKIQVNNKNKLKNSIVYIQPSCFAKIKDKLFNENFKKINGLTKRVYRLRYSPNDNNYLCFLALGSIEAYLNFVYPSKSIQDLIPGLFIAQMAGAKITDLKGRKLEFSKPKQLYIASNTKIHDQLIKIINS